MGIAPKVVLWYSCGSRSGRTRFRVSSRLGDRSGIPGLDWRSAVGSSMGVPLGVTSQTQTQTWPVGLGQCMGKQPSTHGYT